MATSDCEMLLLQVDLERQYKSVDFHAEPEGTKFWAAMDDQYPDIFADWRDWEIVPPAVWAEIQSLPGFGGGPAIRATPLPRKWTQYSKFGCREGVVAVSLCGGMLLIGGRQYEPVDFHAEPDLLEHFTGWYLTPVR